MSTRFLRYGDRLNESPSEKEGKYRGTAINDGRLIGPSMKAPPKRKGNWWRYPTQQAHKGALNESPYEK